VAAPIDSSGAAGAVAARSSSRSARASAASRFSRTLYLFERVSSTSTRGRDPRPRRAAKDVVVVGVDDTTFNETGYRWPFPRSIEAKVIDRLVAAGAKVIAEDIQYTERTTPMPGCGDLCQRIADDEDQHARDLDLEGRPQGLEGGALDDGGRQERDDERARRQRAARRRARGERQLPRRCGQRHPPLPVQRSSPRSDVPGRLGRAGSAGGRSTRSCSRR
jgi:hypothetical protein